MSVVSTMEAVPNRIAGVVRYLRDHRSASDDELRAAFQPAALREKDSTVIYREVMSECADLGLVRRDDNQWGLVLPFATDAEFQTQITRRLTGGDSEAQLKVARALAWLLTLDPLDPLPIGEPWRSQIESDLAGDPSDLTTPARCQQFAIWAIHLGCGWRLGSAGKEYLVADPTEALLRELRLALEPGERAPLQAALQRIGERCPIFEFGEVRIGVESTIPAARRRAEDGLSRATALALQRMERRGAIRLETEADFPALVMPTGARVSHVTLGAADV